MLVSICIPTYSRLEYLKQAVQCALTQDYEDIEICVSQDPTPAGFDIAIKRWCEEQTILNKKINYNLNNKRLGLAGNWNKLVSISKGEYIIIQGDDDLLNKRYVSAIMNLVNKTDADVAFCNQNFIGSDGNIFIEDTKKLNKLYKRDSLTTGLIKNPIKTVFNNSVPMSSSLIRRDLLLQYKFDEAINTPEFEIFLHLALEKKKFVYCDEQLASYRLHNNSATSSGLSIDKFLKKIIAIAVPEEYIPQKREFIASKIIPAINMSLKRGDKSLAKQLLSSDYYPQKNFLKKLVQHIFCVLPSWAVNKIL